MVNLQLIAQNADAPVGVLIARAQFEMCTGSQRVSEYVTSTAVTVEKQSGVISEMSGMQCAADEESRSRMEPTQLCAHRSVHLP